MRRERGRLEVSHFSSTLVYLCEGWSANPGLLVQMSDMSNDIDERATTMPRTRNTMTESGKRMNRNSSHGKDSHKAAAGQLEYWESLGALSNCMQRLHKAVVVTCRVERCQLMGKKDGTFHIGHQTALKCLSLDYNLLPVTELPPKHANMHTWL